MKLRALLVLLLAAVLPLAAPRPASAADVSFDYFYDALRPYGEWIEVTGYGFCWRPTEVEADWTPYADGYWAFTDAGWTWVGYEDFAGIVYHYGRWVSVEGEGWCWVPDYEWGPAWVSWRKSDDFIGWAPLPPRAYWQPEIGISTWVDTVCDIGPAFYSFCRVRDFGAPVLRPVLISRARNVTIIRSTVNITNITYNSYGEVPVIYNGGLNFTAINGRCDRPIPALKLVRQTHFDRPDFHAGPGRFSPNARTVGNQLFVNAPIVAPPVQPGFLQDKVKKVFAAEKVGNGWAGVKDAKERTELRQRFQRETKGLTPYTAPARAVLAAELKVVPTQADPQAVRPGLGGPDQHSRGDRTPPPVAVAPGPVAPPIPPVVVPGEARPADPRSVTAKDREREKGRGKNDGGSPPQPVVVAPPVVPVVPVVPAPVPVVGAPLESRGPQPKPDAPVGRFHRPGENPQPVADRVRPAKPVAPPVVADPAAASVQAATEAARAAREQAAAAEKVRSEQERASRQRDTELREKQAADKAKVDASDQQRAAQMEREKLQAEQERMTQQRATEAQAAAVREKQTAEQAATAARERVEREKQNLDLDKRRAAQVEADKLRGEQERANRQREAEAGAAALRQKQAGEAASAASAQAQAAALEQQRAAQMEREKLQAQQERAVRQRAADEAAAQQKQHEAQRQEEAGKQAEQQRQQAAARAREGLQQQQEQLAEQRRQLQMEQQNAVQGQAKQRAAERAREQQAEQQHAAQEAARQQVAEQRKQLQIEQQRAAEAQHQQAAQQRQMEQHRTQQAEQQRAAQEAAKQQAAEQNRQQQMEQQKEAARQQAAAQQQAAQQQATQERRRGEKDKDKDKDKGR